MGKQGSDERRSARSKVMLVATLVHGGTGERVRVLDLSPHGALITGKTLPDEDAAISFNCGEHVIQGWIAWAQGDYAGLIFGNPVTHEKLLPKLAPTSSLITEDKRVKKFRRPGFRGDQMSVAEKRLLEQLASEW